MADKVPSRADRVREAGLPVRATTAELAKMGQVTFLEGNVGQARNPQTGEMNDGWLVIVADKSGRKFRSFIGGKALVRELNEMFAELADGMFPFTATIVREGEGPGHPYTFAD